MILIYVLFNPIILIIIYILYLLLFDNMTCIVYFFFQNICILIHAQYIKCHGYMYVVDAKNIFFSLYVFGEPEVHFRNFL
jgi:hypothetical protein